jgi:hypothetical protein
MQIDDWEGRWRGCGGWTEVTAAAPLRPHGGALATPAGTPEAAILRGIDPEAEGRAVTDIVRQIRAGDGLAGRDPESGSPADGARNSPSGSAHPRRS